MNPWKEETFTIEPSNLGKPLMIFSLPMQVSENMQFLLGDLHSEKHASKITL